MDVRLRQAELFEADAVARLLWRVRHHNVGSLPAPVHDLDDMQRWMREVVFPGLDVSVAESAGRLVGLMVLRAPDWLEHLYVDPDFTGRGIGLRFLRLAQQRFPEGLQLWAFQSNLAGRRFYERHGFTAVELTDGDNEEGAPDVRYVWRHGRTPDAEDCRRPPPTLT